MSFWENYIMWHIIICVVYLVGGNHTLQSRTQGWISLAIIKKDGYRKKLDQDVPQGETAGKVFFLPWVGNINRSKPLLGPPVVVVGVTVLVQRSSFVSDDV